MTVELHTPIAMETNLRFEVETATYCFQSAETAESFVRFQTQGRP